MPELPEVETMRRGILAVQGQRIEQVILPPCRFRPLTINLDPATLAERLMGQGIEKVGRRGKRILLHFTDRSALIFEPRMTGLALVADPPDQEHLRLQLELGGAGAARLLFWDRRGLGHLKWFSEEQLEQELGPHRLGPDALELDAKRYRERLGKSQREIKIALLDQQAIAGIGNLYAAEILFEAHIDPRARCCRLQAAQWQRLAAATQHVLREAIRYEGSTLADGTYRNALNQDGSYQNHHRVYARVGEDCSRCGQATIRRIVQAQRSTFFCPTCQRKTDRALRLSR